MARKEDSAGWTTKNFDVLRSLCKLLYPISSLSINFDHSMSTNAILYAQRPSWCPGRKPDVTLQPLANGMRNVELDVMLSLRNIPRKCTSISMNQPAIVTRQASNRGYAYLLVIVVGDVVECSCQPPLPTSIYSRFLLHRPATTYFGLPSFLLPPVRLALHANLNIHHEHH